MLNIKRIILKQQKRFLKRLLNISKHVKALGLPPARNRGFIPRVDGDEIYPIFTNGFLRHPRKKRQIKLAAYGDSYAMRQKSKKKPISEDFALWDDMIKVHDEDR